MKRTSLPLAAAFFALVSSASAFNVDFGSYFASGDTLGAKTINVPGYGNILLTAGVGSTLDYNNSQGSDSLVADNNEELFVNFQNGSISNLAFNYVGLNSAAGEEFTASGPTSPVQYIVTLNNSTNGAGISGFSFDVAAVPEPSTALFGLLGGLGMLFIRKR